MLAVDQQATPSDAPEAPGRSELLEVVVSAALVGAIDAALEGSTTVIADALRGASGEIFAKAAADALDRARAARAALLSMVGGHVLVAGGRLASVQVRPSIESVIRAVAMQFGVRSADIVGTARHASVAMARHVAMFLSKKRLGTSFPEIGRAFGYRDHTTVMSACRKITGLMLADSNLRANVDAAEIKAFGGRQP